MTLAIIGLIAALAATGVIGSGAFGKLASAGSSGKAGKNSWWNDFWSGIKEAWKKGWLATKLWPHNDNSGSDVQTGSNEIPDDFIVNPYSGKGESNINGNYSGANLGVASASSAQANAQTTADPGSVVAHVENSENGSGGQGVDNTVDWIKQILLSLGLGNLFGSSGDSDWRSYEDIVDDERKYGQGMIADARRWEEYMASTAYQRTVKDIEAAGLNPWLAVQSGSLSPANWGSVDSGSALGSISTSLSQSLSNSNSNSSSAIIVALIMMIAKMAMS